MVGWCGGFCGGVVGGLVVLGGLYGVVNGVGADDGLAYVVAVYGALFVFGFALFVYYFADEDAVMDGVGVGKSVVVGGVDVAV